MSDGEDIQEDIQECQENIPRGYIYLTEKEIDGFDAYKLGFSETQMRGGLLSVYSDYDTYKTLKAKFRDTYDRKGHYFIGNSDEMSQLVFATKFIEVSDTFDKVSVGKNLKKHKRKIVVGLILLAFAALVIAWIVDKFVE